MYKKLTYWLKISIMIKQIMKYIYFKTIGSIDPTLIHSLVQSFDFIHDYKLIADTAYPQSAYQPKRKQYHAREIIEVLSSDIPSDCEKLIAVTDIDLCTPILTFVFGEAQLDGRVAVVSVNRLRQEFYSLPEDKALLVTRLSKVCVHELGHCYGLIHCGNCKCVMHLSNNIASIDDKNKEFCTRCGEFLKNKMRKENHGQE